MQKIFKLSALVALVWVALLPAQAQNVTISQKTGNMLPTLQTGYGEYTETGFAAGAFALWHHYQLELVMIGADYTAI